jgi:F-type H+-transporting ATPase subunit epsilon
MNVEIVTPEKVLFSNEGEMVVCRTTNGDVAFLEGHEPFLALLAPGNIRVINGEEEISFSCSTGFVEVNGHEVRIISDDAKAV